MLAFILQWQNAKEIEKGFMRRKKIYVFLENLQRKHCKTMNRIVSKKRVGLKRWLKCQRIGFY